MYCSFASRNSLIISGVVISHLLVLLGLLSRSLDGVKSSIPGIQMVYLASVSGSSSPPKKSLAEHQDNAFSSTENKNLIQPFETPSHIGIRSARQWEGELVRQAIYRPKPHYPLISKKLREQGLVIIRMCVNERGVVDEASISKSSGFLNLDASAIKALLQWRFQPLTFNSPAYSSQCFQTPVQFSLEG